MKIKSVRLTILCENSVAKPGRAIGEHGFACLVESPGCTLLFDTGQGLGLATNATEYGVDLGRIDGIVLSHGHYDHGDGLPVALAHSGPVPVYAHPGIFAERFWQSSFETRSIGLSQTRGDYEGLGACFELSRTPRQLAPGVWLTGEVPRVIPYETGDPHLTVRDGENYRPDLLLDDQSLVIEGRDGLVILLGCAHAGLINIIHHARKITGVERIHAVVGGTHLGPVSDEQYNQTLSTLRGFRIQRLAIGHCTGLIRSAQLLSTFPGRCTFAAVGSSFDF